MLPENYQRLAERTECNHEHSRRLLSGYSTGIYKVDELPVRLNQAIVGMTTELGELAGTFNEFIYFGRELDKDACKEELGDILWYVAEACNSLGLSMSEVMQANIRKLERRYPERYTDQLCQQRDIDREKEAIVSDSYIQIESQSKY